MSKYKRIIQDNLQRMVNKALDANRDDIEDEYRRQRQIEMQKFEHEFDVRVMREIMILIDHDTKIDKVKKYPDHPAFDKFRDRIYEIQKVKAKQLHIIITNIKRYIEKSENPRKIKLYLDVLDLLEKGEYYKARQLIVYQ